MIQHRYLKRRRGYWTQTSAGIVVVRPNHRSVLLLRNFSTDDWEFAKGKLEPDESALQAARRELAEEAGIRRVAIRPRWRRSIRYSFTLPRIGQVHKTVHYFLATTRDRVKLSSEHRAARWVTWQQAERLLRHRNYQNMLTQVRKALHIG